MILHQRDETLPSLRNFFIIFTGQAFSLFGSRLVQFALVWWLTKTIGSASVLAFASIMAILPQVLIGPFAGTLVDRWNRRIILMASDGVIAVAVVILAILYTLDVVQVWHIYLLMVIRSIGGAFQWPAMQASTSLMVPSQHLSRVSGLHQAVHGLANIVAPPMGAVLLELLPIEHVLAIDVIPAMLAIGSLVLIAIPQPRDSRSEAQRSVLSDLREGFRYLWGLKGVMWIMIIAMVINFLANPAFSLTPILVISYFEGGVFELAWLQSAAGIGMVLGGIMLGIWGGFKQRIKTALLALVLVGVSILFVGVTPKNVLVLAVGAMFCFGVTNSMSNALSLAILQATVPAEIQGRIFTLLLSGVMSMSPIGLAVAGPVADVVGVQVWFIIAGIPIILMGVTSFFIRSIITIEAQRQES